MKLEDVILAIQATTPRYSSQLTDSPVIASAVHASGVATIATAAAHGLAVGNAACFEGVLTRHAMTAITVLAENQVEFETTLDHDVTEGWIDHAEIEIAGTGGGLDGTFAVVSSVSRRKFVLQYLSDPSAFPTAGALALGVSNLYNSLRGTFAVVSVPTTTTFTVALAAPAGDLGTLDVSGATLRANPRVTGAVTEEAAFDSYSQDPDNGAQTWAYVIRGENTVSRDRRGNLDAVSTEQATQDYRAWILNPFTILVATPSADQERARAAVDLMEDLRPALLRAVLGKQFATGLAITPGEGVQFVGDTFTRYDHGAYWHAFLFEADEEITFDDTVGIPDNVAFRDINFTTKIDIGQDQTEATTPMSDTIDLDETPVGP